MCFLRKWLAQLAFLVLYRRKIYRIDQNLTILNLNCFHIINQITVISWYRCESDIAIFAWRVTWNYVYSPCFVDSFNQAKKGSVLRMYTVHCTGKGRECKNFSSFMLHCIVSTFHIGFPMRGFYLRAIASPCAQGNLIARNSVIIPSNFLALCFNFLIRLIIAQFVSATIP